MRAQDTPNEEKLLGQGIRGTARRPDHVRPSAYQEGLDDSDTAGPPPGHQHSWPFSGGGRTSLDGPDAGQAGLQDPNSGQRGPERAASCGLLTNSAGSPPPGGRRTGNAGVHAGFRLGIHDRYRSLTLIYPILHTNIEPGSPQNQAENMGGGKGGGGFVDLRAMLSGSGEEAYAIQVGQTDGAPSLQLVSQKRSAPLTLPAWIKAWNRFCAILSEQDTSVTAGLAHHMENVLNVADKKAGWRYYDEQFRHLIGSGMAAWGATHLELYMKAHLERPSTNDTRQHTPVPTALGKHATGSLLSLPQHGAVHGSQPVQVPTQMLQLPGRPSSLPLPPATPRAIQNHAAVSWRKGFGEYVR